jgi:hypothetical protein
MKSTVPPPNLPRVTFDDGSSRGRLRLRLSQVFWTAVTVLATAWLCTLGPIPAVLAIVVAKHVLVALLLMGIGIDREVNRA